MFEKGISLDYSIDENIEIEMNEFKVQQLVSILIDNAIKHSEKDGTITVNLKKEKDIVLTVSNTGEGIPKGEEEKIFERFYRADEARNFNGTGLGLSIAKLIVDKHEGHFEIVSREELGTRIEIYLPRVAAEAVSSPEQLASFS